MRPAGKRRETRTLLRGAADRSVVGTWPARYGPGVALVLLFAAALAHGDNRPGVASVLLTAGSLLFLSAILFAGLQRFRQLRTRSRTRAAMRRYLGRGAGPGEPGRAAADPELRLLSADPVLTCLLARELDSMEQERLRRGLLQAGAWAPVEEAIWTRPEREAEEAVVALAWLDPERAVGPLGRLARGRGPERGAARPRLRLAAAAALADLADLEGAAGYEALLDLLEKGDLRRSLVARLLDEARCDDALARLERRSAASSPAARFWIRYLAERRRDPDRRSLFMETGAPAVDAGLEAVTVRGFVGTAAEGGRSVIRVLVVIGAWILFFYWWTRVLEGVRWPDLVILGSWITVALVVIGVIAALWIAHNLKLALHGSRGSSSRYHVPAFSLDVFGRDLRVEEGAEAARRVSVSVRDGAKVYEAVDAAVPVEVHT